MHHEEVSSATSFLSHGRLSPSGFSFSPTYLPTYRSAYVGAMVADVHRVLVEGGVYGYPGTKKAPKGKIRLLYEANPMSMLVGR